MHIVQDGCDLDFHSEFRLCFFGHSRRIPWRSEGEFDLNTLDSGNRQDFFFDFTLNRLEQGTTERRQCHGYCGGAVCDRDVVDESQIHNRNAKLRIENGYEGFFDDGCGRFL